MKSTTRRTYPYREGYPYQVWKSVNCWDHTQGQMLHCHAQTREAAEEEARTLRRYKIMGRNGLTRKNYYGRVTVRRVNLSNTEVSGGYREKNQNEN